MTRRIRIAALAFALAAASTAHADPLRYVILVDGGKQAGEMVVDDAANGDTTVRYIFKDNGRGPELDERYRLADDGSYAELKVTGTTTFGAPIEEFFRRDGTQATWKSTSEQGSTTDTGGALYIPLGGTPQGVSVALAAMAKRGTDTLPLLPGGTLTHRVLQEVELEHAGGKRSVRLIAQTGLGLSPDLFWSTAASGSEPPRLFAYIVPGYLAATEQGWEQHAERLTTLQQQAEGQLVRDFAARHFQKLDGLTVVRNARVFDPVSGSVGAPSDIYVLRGRVTSIVPTGSPDSGARTVIDAEGRIALPGLFDMHGHEFGKWGGALHLANGITSVRDMGNDNATLQGLIDEIARGEVMGPQIIPAGFLEGESNFSARNGFVISTLEEARSAIDWYAQHGYPQLKIYNSFPKEILRETVAYAHQRGLRVSGHVPAFLRAQDVIDAGFDEIQHINQLLLNFFVTPTTDTRTLERFRLPAEMTADLDFDSRPVQDFIASLKANNVAVDPTLATFDYIRQRPGEVSQAYAAIIDRLPLTLQRQFRSAEMNIPDDATAARYNRSYEKMIDFVGRLHKAGIVVLPGTDALPGFTLHRELELYVMAGMTPVEALRAATTVSAKAARVDHERGRIAPGMLADIVLVDGDPTKDISAVRNVVRVVTQGRGVEATSLFPSLGIASSLH